MYAFDQFFFMMQYEIRARLIYFCLHKFPTCSTTTTNLSPNHLLDHQLGIVNSPSSHHHHQTITLTSSSDYCHLIFIIELLLDCYHQTATLPLCHHHQIITQPSSLVYHPTTIIRPMLSHRHQSVA